MQYKAIDIGCGKNSTVLPYVSVYLPDWVGQVDVVRLDGNKKYKPDVLHNITKPMPERLKGKFDFAYMGHVLEHIPFRLAPAVAREVASLVKEGGYFLISVPSLEWACKEVIRGNFNIGVLMTIYGGQDDKWLYHYCGFTRPALTKLAKDIGMKVYSLKEGAVIVFAGEKAFNSTQHELFMRKE
jgi:SAM-dependent methyltransferase